MKKPLLSTTAKAWLVGVGLFAVFVVLANLAPKKEMAARSRPQTTTSSPKVEPKPEPAPKPEPPCKYDIVDLDETSHAAAYRVTVTVRLRDKCSKTAMRSIISNVTERFKEKYDIIWVDIVPSNAKPPDSVWSIWRPTLCKTKWINPQLAEEYWTTDNVGTIEEQHKGISINWSDAYLEDWEWGTPLAEPKSETEIRKFIEESPYSQFSEFKQKKILDQFSSWDGSHKTLEKLIKLSMNDPNSYDHVETYYWDKGDHLVVQTTFRGSNMFGAIVTQTVKATVDLDGNVLEVFE